MVHQTEEDCVQVSKTQPYINEMMLECHKYKEQLQHAFPNMPDECRFAVKPFPHDFGTYYEVVVYYEPNDEKSVEYAFNVEANLPAKWEEQWKPAASVTV